MGLWVNDEVEFEPIEQISIFEKNVFESQFIKVKTSKNKFCIVGNIYRPNSAPLANLPGSVEILDTILNTIETDPILNKAENVHLCGDTNIDLLNYQVHGHTREYLNTLLNHGQLPLITLPTRITATTTVIDHISTSIKSDYYDAGIIHSSLFDHLPVFFISSSIVSRPPTKYIKSRKINDKTTPAFKTLLNSFNWTENILDENRPKQAFNNFFNIIDSCVDLAFPEVTTKTSNKYTPINPWMSGGLLTSRKQKEKLASKKLRKPSETNTSAFKTYNRIYTKLVRTAKKTYYDTKFTDFSTNMRKTWDTIREVIGSKKHRENIPDYFRNNGRLLIESLDIAEGFNDFFSGIGPKLANEIPPSNVNFKDFMGEPSENEFIFAQITPDILDLMASKLKPKRSAGPDNISTKLLKEIIPIILIPLCHLFNLSLQTGYIPIQLKSAKVIPIFKSGDKHDFNNYRPISLLSSLSKLLEKIVASQMLGFLNKFKYFYKHQYGFRKRHNTSHPIIHFLDKIYDSLNKNNPEYTLSVFIDLKKAFDTVDHKILIQKMDHYGFHGMSKTWFENYLTDRVQFVSINGKNSLPQKINCGVPQGSVLGPLLFLIFINDLPSSTKFLTLLFADDTTFQMSSTNLQSLFSLANIELRKAAIWFQTNKLTLNVSKTKYMLFRTKGMKVDFSNLKLNIGGENIDRIGSNCKTKFFKFVGHHLDEFLSWESQINHVHGKLASANFAIARVKNFLPRKIRMTLYNSLFRSHMEFGIMAFGRAALGKLNKIKIIQKKCIRNVAGKGHRSHTDPLFASLNILKFDDLFRYNCSTFMHKYIFNKLPPSFENKFTPFAPPNRPNGFIVDGARISFLEQFPAYFLPRIWNENSLENKNLESHTSFKNAIFESLIIEYPPAFKCKSKTCPDCH